jgi:hypothetical protein
MKCSHASRYFDSLYVNDATVDPAVKEHLRSCPRCTHAYEQWTALAKTLQSVPAEQTPPGLAQRIKERLRADGQRQSGSFRIHAFRPRLAFVIPNLLAVAGVIAVLLILPKTHAPVIQMQKAHADLVSRSFSVALQGAHKVTIAGDFNGWDAKSDTLARNKDGAWAITLQLSRGDYQYQFIIDNTTWVPDPGNPVRINDGFGGFNSGMEL